MFRWNWTGWRPAITMPGATSMRMLIPFISADHAADAGAGGSLGTLMTGAGVASSASATARAPP